MREGVQRRAYFRHGAWQDAVLFALLREDLDDAALGDAGSRRSDE